MPLLFHGMENAKRNTESLLPNAWETHYYEILIRRWHTEVENTEKNTLIIPAENKFQLNRKQHVFFLLIYRNVKIYILSPVDFEKKNNNN